MFQTIRSQAMFRNLACLLLVLAGCVVRLSGATFNKLLTGRNMSFGVITLPPYVTIQRDKTGRMIGLTGFVDQLVLYLAEKYRFTFEYVDIPGEVWGALVVNETTKTTYWNGLVGMVADKNVDFIASALSVTYERYQAIDFTWQFIDDHFCLLIPYPTTGSTIASIIKPFQKEVWAMIVISLLGASVALCLIGRFDFKLVGNGGDKGRRYTFWPSVVYFLRSWVNAGIQIDLKRPWMYVMVGIWSLCAIVISNCYNTSITSYLMAPRYVPVISSVEDLAANADYQFIARKFSVQWNGMMQATTGPWKGIGDSLRQHPENSLVSLANVTDLVANHRKVFAQQYSAHLARMATDLKATGQCRLYIANKPFDVSRVALGLPKNSPLTNVLNKDIIWMRQMGLLDYWKRRSWPQTNRCSVPLATKPSSHIERMSLNYLSSAFLLYGVGIGISFLSFLLELIVGMAKNNARN